MADAMSVVQQYYDCISRNDMDGTARCLADDYVYHGTPSFSAEQQPKEEYVASFHEISRAMPDHRIEVQDRMTSGDEVCTISVHTATLTGSVMGIEGNGQPIRFTAITRLRVRDGKIAEEWEQYDSLGVAQQMGLVPAPA